MRSYFGILVRQRENTDIIFLLLSAPAKDVYSWSQADDIRIDKGNVQRALVDSRWRQVKKFFASSSNNIIPTSVTVAFDEEVKAVQSVEELNETDPAYFMRELENGFVEITFPDAVKDNAFIIDGQHRLKGMSDLDEGLEVPVCLFPALSRLERAFQFVTINNKSHKVPTDNLKALIRNFEDIEEGLRARLSQASITSPRFATHVDVMNEDTEGPFFKLVSWVNNRHDDRKELITPAAIENSIKIITKAFPETKDDPADAIIVMSAIWKSIFAHYDITFENVDEFVNLTKKATIQRVTEMLIEYLVKQLDPAFSSGKITQNNAEEASRAATKLMYGIPVEFWKEKWKLKGLDTDAGRNLISQSIRIIKRILSNSSEDEELNWRDKVPLFNLEDSRSNED